MVDGQTVAKLEGTKRNSSEMSGEDEVSDTQLAQWWLDFGITRKITKRNCMTFLSVGAGHQIGGQHVNLTHAEKPSDIYQHWREPVAL